MVMPLPFRIYVSSSLPGDDTNSGFPDSTYGIAKFVGISVTAGATTITIPEAVKGPLNPGSLGYSVHQVDGLANNGALLVLTGAGVGANDRVFFRITNASGLTGAGNATLTLSHAIASTATVTVNIGGTRATLFGNISRKLYSQNSGAATGDYHNTGWLISVADGHTETLTSVVQHRASSDVTTNGRIGIEWRGASSLTPGVQSQRPLILCDLAATANAIEDMASGASANVSIAGLSFVTTNANAKGSCFRWRSALTVRECDIVSPTGTGAFAYGVFADGQRGMAVLGCNILNSSNTGVYLAAGIGASICNNTIARSSAASSTRGIWLDGGNAHELTIVGNVIGNHEINVLHGGTQTGGVGTVGPTLIAHNTLYGASLMALRLTAQNTSTGIYGNMRLLNNLFAYNAADLDFSATTNPVTAAYLNRVHAVIACNATTLPASSLATTWDADVGGVDANQYQTAILELFTGVQGVSPSGIVYGSQLARAGIGSASIGAPFSTPIGSTRSRR
jgi:hypothetical protein